VCRENDGRGEKKRNKETKNKEMDRNKRGSGRDRKMETETKRNFEDREKEKASFFLVTLFSLSSSCLQTRLVLIYNTLQLSATHCNTLPHTFDSRVQRKQDEDRENERGDCFRQKAKTKIMGEREGEGGRGRPKRKK